MRTPGMERVSLMQLPDRPNLRHLRDQAKDLVRSGGAPALADAQLLVARQYGFSSWPKLKQHVESLQEIGELNQAIAANDLARVQELLTSRPELRQVLIDDVPLMAVAQPGRIPMMELLVRYGADVNGLRWGWFPVLFTPCENLEPEPLQWLLDHGADPNRGCPHDPATTALDYVIQTYPRDPENLTACIEKLLAAGAHTRYDVPGLLPILRGRTDELAALLDADSALLHRRYHELDCGASGGRLLTLRGATLLHVAAEYGFFDATRGLLDRGADVNARADIDASGVGGQTPIFHALTHFKAVNPEVAQLLIDRGADLTIRARVPGHYERPGELLDVSAAEYAAIFPLS
jgi:ankyrin repeat protein